MITYPIRHEEPKRATAPAPQRSYGARVTVNGLGYAVSTDPVGSGSFQGFFRPSLFAGGLLLTRGEVEGIEPKIGNDWMSETVLPLQAGEQNAKGESWAALEVVPTADGTLTDETPIRVIHTSDPKFFTPQLGRKGLALILWSGNRPVRVEHIVWWNLSYLRITEGTATRHLLL